MTVRVVCSSCDAVYNVPEDRVSSDVVRATCKVCGNEIEIRREDFTDESSGVSEPTGSLPPIPHDDPPTGSWEKAIVDNTEADRLLGVDSTTIPPSPGDRSVDEPTVDEPPGTPQGRIQNLGDQVVASRADLDRVFPEDDPEPPKGLGSPPAAAKVAGKQKKKRRRRRRSLPFRLLRLFIVMVAILFVVSAAFVVATMYELI